MGTECDADWDADRVAARRAHYASVGLDASELASDPIVQFQIWHKEIVSLEVPEPNAMVLSTVSTVAILSGDVDPQPSSRHVLLKEVRPEGFVFFTNYGSRKGRELEANPRASLCFPWFCIGRQVVVTGVVTKVTSSESDAYFASRPRASQLGAWASAHQSDVVASRAVLDEARGLVAQVGRGERQLEHAVRAVQRDALVVLVHAGQVVVHEMRPAASGQHEARYG